MVCRFFECRTGLSDKLTASYKQLIWPDRSRVACPAGEMRDMKHKSQSTDGTTSAALLFLDQAMKNLLGFCIFCVLSLVGQVAWAQTQVTSVLVAQLVEMVDGKAVLKPATQSKPGDVIDYSSTYKNSGTAAAEKLLATLPVPVGTTLLSGSAQPGSALASTDGSVFAPIPLMRSVRQADGSQRTEPVPMADYRALRWDLGTLAAGRTAVVSLRVRIDSTAVATPAVKPASRP